MVFPGLRTRLSDSKQSLLPSFSKKYPHARDLGVRFNVRNAGSAEVRVKIDSPYCPGRMVPKLRRLGSFKPVDFFMLCYLSNTLLYTYSNFLPRVSKTKNITNKP